MGQFCLLEGYDKEEAVKDSFFLRLNTTIRGKAKNIGADVNATKWWRSLGRQKQPKRNKNCLLKQ
jgi:hypothetical protein